MVNYTSADNYPGNEYQPLFNHLSQEHGLTLLQSEMDEIRNICRDMDKGAEWEAEREKWISITDALPNESNGRLLVWVKEVTDLGISEYCWNCSYSSLHGFTDNGITYNVSHWQPLPSPPKKSKQ